MARGKRQPPRRTASSSSVASRKAVQDTNTPKRSVSAKERRQLVVPAAADSPLFFPAESTKSPSPHDLDEKPPAEDPPAEKPDNQGPPQSQDDKHEPSQVQNNNDCNDDKDDENISQSGTQQQQQQQRRQGNYLNNGRPLSTPAKAAPRNPRFSRTPSIQTQKVGRPGATPYSGKVVTRPGTPVTSRICVACPSGTATPKPGSAVRKPLRMASNPTMLTPHPITSSSSAVTPVTGGFTASSPAIMQTPTAQAATNLKDAGSYVASAVSHSSPSKGSSYRSTFQGVYISQPPPPLQPFQTGTAPSSIRGLHVALHSTFGSPEKLPNEKSPGVSCNRFPTVTASPASLLRPAVTTMNTPIKSNETPIRPPGAPMGLTTTSGKIRALQNSLTNQGMLPPPPSLNNGLGFDAQNPVRSHLPGDPQARVGKRTLGDVQMPVGDPKSGISPAKRIRTPDKENIYPASQKKPGANVTFPAQQFNVQSTPALSTVSASELNKENITPRVLIGPGQTMHLVSPPVFKPDNEFLASEAQKCLFMVAEMDKKIVSLREGLNQTVYLKGLVELRLRAIMKRKDEVMDVSPERMAAAAGSA